MFCGNAPSSWGDTPLMYACNNGHTKAAAEFLPYLTDPDSITKALFWSAGSGHAACVGLILQHATVDVNAKYMGETLLFKAGKCAGTAKRLAAMSVISTARLRSSIEPIPKVA
ncbi:hypothetical protein PENSUB_13065 [Penicillium subrubescens]|uniref:Uncharacterized protein n=1 Tax=Penicillium subrubescens TaxID=1316194 RepID=A0A1Q5SUG7_9EURO|nr:hypothetical protein PENSUB_13065 [Penicillium subrubescens]